MNSYFLFCSQLRNILKDLRRLANLETDFSIQSCNLATQLRFFRSSIN